MAPFEPQSSESGPSPSGPVRAVVLAIGGSDSSGGAGIQADLRTVLAHGLHAATTITAITAQGPRGFRGWLPVPTEMVRAQLEAALADWPIGAVKTGMLANAAIVRAVAAALSRDGTSRLPLVVDPVLGSSSGAELLDAEGRAALIAELFPRATVITPNLPEAAALSGLPLSASPAEHAAQIARLAPRAVIVVKGGHGDASAAVARDTARFPDGRIVHLDAPRIATDATQGTGCTFASAIAAQLARGSDVLEALVSAKAYLTGALTHAVPLVTRHAGKSGPLAHLWSLAPHDPSAPDG